MAIKETLTKLLACRFQAWFLQVKEIYLESFFCSIWGKWFFDIEFRTNSYACNIIACRLSVDIVSYCNIDIDVNNCLEVCCAYWRFVQRMCMLIARMCVIWALCELWFMNTDCLCDTSVKSHEMLDVVGYVHTTLCLCDVGVISLELLTISVVSLMVCMTHWREWYNI